jgi:hypothetical protein
MADFWPVEQDPETVKQVYTRMMTDMPYIALLFEFPLRIIPRLSSLSLSFMLLPS